MSTPSTTSSMSSKPGRKPLHTEPKNKRTAQNRAAQRAFRERKERKMKELEMQVEMLENEKLQITNESELLRVQVETLMKQLSKYKNASSSDMPTVNSVASTKSVSTLSDKSSDTPSPYVTNQSPASSLSSNNIFDEALHMSNSTNPSSSSFSRSKSQTESFQFPSPWGLSSNTPQSDSLSKSDLSTNSPLDINQSTLKGGDYSEGVSQFCGELSSVCGTASCPVPKERRDSAYLAPTSSIIDGSIGSHSTNTLNPDSLFLMSANDSPFQALADSAPRKSTSNASDMALLYDSTPFDTSLVFNNDSAFTPNSFFNANIDDDFMFEDNNKSEQDPLAGLVTEESKDDPFSEIFSAPDSLSQQLGSNTLNALNCNNHLPTIEESKMCLKKDDESDEMVAVPDNSANLMKCSQIWERITNHPRFSDLDIDGLCSELKSKAKCSEKGVVVDGGDVGKLLKDALVKSNMKKVDVTVNSFMKGL